MSKKKIKEKKRKEKKKKHWTEKADRSLKRNFKENKN